MRNPFENREPIFLGMQLESIGEIENAKKLYIKHIEKYAKTSLGNDALIFLYGKDIYKNNVQNYIDAITYLFVAPYAVELVEIIQTKEPASFSTGWAQCDAVTSDTRENRAVLNFFKWLSESRIVKNEDVQILKNTISAFTSGVTLNFKMTSSIQRKSLSQIVEEIIAGNIRVIGSELI